MKQEGVDRAIRVPLSEIIRAANTLADPDYASAFQVRVGTQSLTPGRWARITLEEAPRALRWFVLCGWRVILGLRLGHRGSPDHVLGWKIQSTAPDWLALEACSALITAHKVLRVEGRNLTAATFVRFERRWSRAIWAIVAPVHHRTESLLLRIAVARR
ncbi:MAG: DUF2867 domain-containing protein [Jatrophihabitans sp.]